MCVVAPIMQITKEREAKTQLAMRLLLTLTSITRPLRLVLKGKYRFRGKMPPKILRKSISTKYQIAVNQLVRAIRRFVTCTAISTCG
jgi:hypothetical protein